jgi:hypothetical protein
MTDDANDRDYEVGYGKPPKATRFRKGQSGNPKGRPKSSRNVAMLLEEALFHKILIKDERGSRRVTVVEAFIQRVTRDALKGDPRAVAKMLDLIRFYEPRSALLRQDRDADDGAPFKATDQDLEIMRYLAREIESSKASDEEGPA